MSLENARANLQALAGALQLPAPELKDERSCALFAKEGFSIHFQYDDKNDQLTVLVPLLESLPQDDKSQAKLYSTLLEAEFAYSQIPMGRIGLNKENNLLLFYESLSMEDDNADKLLILIPPFLEMVELWKDVVEKGQSNEGPPMGERV